MKENEVNQLAKNKEMGHKSRIQLLIDRRRFLISELREVERQIKNNNRKTVN